MSNYLYTDGAARGNPGPASCAWCLLSDEEVIVREGKYLGYTTNNVAEYNALINGLSTAIEREIKIIEIRSDSELMIRQLDGTYAVRSPRLLPLYRKSKELLTKFHSATFMHLNREDPGISNVDLLCNTILDLEKKKKGDYPTI